MFSAGSWSFTQIIELFFDNLAVSQLPNNYIMLVQCCVSIEFQSHYNCNSSNKTYSCRSFLPCVTSLHYCWIRVSDCISKSLIIIYITNLLLLHIQSTSLQLYNQNNLLFLLMRPALKISKCLCSWPAHTTEKQIKNSKFWSHTTTIIIEFD